MGGAAPEVDAAGNIWVGHGERVVVDPLRLQRLGPGAVAGAWPSQAVLRPEHAGRATTATTSTSGRGRPRCSPTGPPCRSGKSSTAYLLNQATLGGIGGQIGPPSAPAAATPTAGTPSQGPSSTSPAATGCRRFRRARSPRSGGRRPGRTARPSRAGGLVWSIGGILPLRAQPGERADGATGLGGRRGQPLPDPVGGRRPAAGPIDRSGLRLLGLGRPSRALPRRRRRRRRTRRTGWSPPTGASSPSATRASSARRAACR